MCWRRRIAATSPAAFMLASTRIRSRISAVGSTARARTEAWGSLQFFQKLDKEDKEDKEEKEDKEDKEDKEEEQCSQATPAVSACRKRRYPVLGVSSSLLATCSRSSPR